MSTPTPYTYRGIALTNPDFRIPYFHLALERDLPKEPYPQALPEGYSFAFYRHGDRDLWIDIELSCNEVKDAAGGEKTFAKYFEPHESELLDRLVFLVDPQDEKVGTATAYYDALGEDDGILGWLHFVGMKEKAQGKGLAKPLIGYTLNRLKDMGYERCHISTQTTSFVAVKIYLDLGFVPTEKSLREEHEGWKIVQEILHHPALDAIIQ